MPGKKRNQFWWSESNRNGPRKSERGLEVTWRLLGIFSKTFQFSFDTPKGTKGVLLCVRIRMSLMLMRGFFQNNPNKLKEIGKM